MTESLRHRWQAEVYDAFKDGAPNGWLIGWDRDRFLKEVRDIARLCDGYLNATSFNYARCDRFEFRIRSEDRQHWVLVVRISFVMDASLSTGQSTGLEASAARRALHTGEAVR